MKVCGSSTPTSSARRAAGRVPPRPKRPPMRSARARCRGRRRSARPRGSPRCGACARSAGPGLPRPTTSFTSDSLGRPAQSSLPPCALAAAFSRRPRRAAAGAASLALGRGRGLALGGQRAPRGTASAATSSSALAGITTDTTAEVRIRDQRHALGQRQVAHVQRVADVERARRRATNRLGNRRAADTRARSRAAVVEDAAVHHAGGAADQVHRHRDLDLLGEIDGVEVGVQERAAFTGSRCSSFTSTLLPARLAARPAGRSSVLSPAALVAQHLLERARVEGDGARLQAARRSRRRGCARRRAACARRPCPRSRGARVASWKSATVGSPRISDEERADALLVVDAADRLADAAGRC